jgi:MOSC domain-containing protein YiiM
MQLLSVNIGQAQPIQDAKASGKTGIYKRPAEGRVQITVDGLQDDVICDTENHGGVDQAVYVYGAPDYAWWSDALAEALAPGTFGENLTITELVSAELSIGDRLRIGAVILEVTSPRAPCVTLARRMGDPGFLKRYREAERPGVYCRVIHEGFVQAGDQVTLEPYPGIPVTAIEIFRDFFSPDRSEATIRRHLTAPIAIRDRIEKEQQLQKLAAADLRNPAS